MNMPAPFRGEIVRQIAESLRDKKDSLSSMIALEVGKMKYEAE
jgi:acyl-CoA reductase-like NAD-dependent aldehyde dehydrogenase